MVVGIIVGVETTILIGRFLVGAVSFGWEVTAANPRQPELGIAEQVGDEASFCRELGIRNPLPHLKALFYSVLWKGLIPRFGFVSQESLSSATVEIRIYDRLDETYSP